MHKWPERNRVQITCNTSSAYPVQHVLCHVEQRDAQLNRVEAAFILALFNWLKPWTDKEWREPEYQEKTSDDELQNSENDTHNPNRDSNPHSSIGGRLRKKTC